MAIYIVTAWGPKCRPGQTEPPSWVAPKDHMVVHRNTYAEATRAARLMAELYKADYMYVDMWEAEGAFHYWGDKDNN